MTLKINFSLLKNNPPPKGRQEIMELLVDGKKDKVVVTVKNQEMASQLMMKKSFEMIKKTGRYLKGLIDYEDLVFDLKNE